MVNWEKGEREPETALISPGETQVGQIEISARTVRSPEPGACPKCGAVEAVDMRWHLGDIRQRGDRSDGYDHPHRYCGPTREDREQHPGEHLHYKCRRCRYDWTGPTKDWSAR